MGSVNLHLGRGLCHCPGVCPMDRGGEMGQHVGARSGISTENDVLPAGPGLSQLERPHQKPA